MIKVRAWGLTLVAAAMAVAGGVGAQAAPILYSAEMSGPAEDPPVASSGTGLALVTYDDAAHTLDVDVTFSGLTGTTTVAHIHCCTAVPGAGNVGVATQVPTFVGFPAGVTFGSYNNTFDLTLASSWNPAFITANGGSAAGAEAALAAGLAAGRAYFNIHSTFAGAGEIRGFFAVPEPATLSLVGIGFAGLAVAARRRR